MYAVIVELPVPPAVNATVAVVSPVLVAVPIVGVCGLVDGVKDEDALEAADCPIAFDAIAVKVYAVPEVKPVTKIGDVALVAVREPGLEVTLKEVADAPDPAVKGTETEQVEPKLTPVTFVGVPIVGVLG